MSSSEPLEPPSELDGGADMKVDTGADIQVEGKEVIQSGDGVTEAQLQTAETLAQSSNTTDEPAPLSKNALKRIRRQREWEEGKDERRKRRKEKRHDARSRQQEKRAALLAAGTDPSIVFPRRPPSKLVPVALILDCDFEQYMVEKEQISLSNQVTRSYSENRYARYRSHLWFAGWKGKMTQRFSDVLADQQKRWRGVGYCEGDFVECAEKAREEMKSNGGLMIPALQRSSDEEKSWTKDEKDSFPTAEPEPEPKEEYKDIVYLTSDSPYTLERLEPHTSYIIGGLVDKNREKGLCYRRARERGIRTAKLPIGQFLVMASRPVLATNHVVEIMLKWLEYEDWGQAFLSVIPKRKGGKLRGDGSTPEPGQRDEADMAEVEEAEVEEAEDGVAAVVEDEPALEEAPAKS